MNNDRDTPITTTEYAYRKLKEWILDGTCVPGEKINQDTYATKLGVSRIPVRTAMDRLASDNLVIQAPRKGCIVSPISKENCRQIFNIRTVLEPMALRETANKARKSDYMRIKENIEEEEPNVSTLADALRLNQEFHFSLYELSGDEVLNKIISNLWEQSQRYRIIYFSKHRRSPRINQEHYKILDLLLKDKTEEAITLLIKHTTTSLDEILESIS